MVKVNSHKMVVARESQKLISANKSWFTGFYVYA